MTPEQQRLIVSAMENAEASVYLPGYGNWYLDTPRTNTYPPDALNCELGHSFHSEADCFLPEGWDNFLCRRCLDVTP